jgi:hypothetical protein
MGNDHGLQVVRRCHINGLPISRVICDEFSRTEKGNAICTEKKCNSPFRTCFICVEQATFEELVIIGSETYVDRSGCCHNHAKNKDADIMEVPAVKRKLAQHEKRLEKNGTSVPDDEDEVARPEIVAERAVLEALSKIEGVVEEQPEQPEESKQNVAPDDVISLFNEQNVVRLALDIVKPSRAVIRHCYHQGELDLIGAELRCVENYTPVRVVRRNTEFHAISSLGHWQMARQLGLKTLRVIIVEASDEREELLASIIADREILCSLELMASVLKLRSLFSELSLAELASKFELPDAEEWLRNLLKLPGLNPQLLRLMDPSIEPRKRLELGTVVRLGLFDLPGHAQSKMADRIIGVKERGLVPEAAQETAAVSICPPAVTSSDTLEDATGLTEKLETDSEAAAKAGQIAVIDTLDVQEEMEVKSGAGCLPAIIEETASRETSSDDEIIKADTSAVPAKRRRKDRKSKISEATETPTTGEEEVELSSTGSMKEEVKRDCMIFEMPISLATCGQNACGYCQELGCGFAASAVAVETANAAVSIAVEETVVESALGDVELARLFLAERNAGRTLAEIAGAYGYYSVTPVKQRLKLLDSSRFNQRILALMDSSLPVTRRLSLSDALRLMEYTRQHQWVKAQKLFDSRA